MKSITRKAVYGFLGLFISQAAFGQANTCNNGDFEQNNFNNWTGYTGNCCPPLVNTPGIVNGRHTLHTDKLATDPMTLDQVRLVCPQGENVSVQLGNSNVGAEAERLRYKFVVTPDNALFTFRYAIILNDAGHEPEAQPRFEINLVDQFNSPVPCGNIKYVASANLPGFMGGTGVDSGAVIFRNWSTELVDLRDYVGQQMTLDFITTDCAWGGHFGYAYIDGVCEEIGIHANSFCSGDSSVTVVAREGFYNYLWSTGDTTQVIQYPNPKDNDSVWVRITPTGGAGCSVTIGLRLKETRISPDFIASGLCKSDSTRFIDSSEIQNASVSTWKWDFGDGTNSNEQNPVHLYAAPGTYNVVLTMTAAEGCKNSVMKPVTIRGPLMAPVPYCDSISYNHIRFAWASVPGAASYSISLDSGLSWQTVTDTFFTAEELPEGSAVTLLIRQADTSCGGNVQEQVTCTTMTCPVLQLSLSNDTMIYQGDTAMLSATASGGSGTYLYTWDPDIGNGPGSYAVDPAQTTLYTVTIEDQHAQECSGASGQILITVQNKPETVEECTFLFKAPNAFSPDGDQVNEEFKVQADCFEEYDLSIYNRWGERLYHTTDIHNGWNGGKQNDRSKLSPEGVYVYIVKIKDRKMQMHSWYGTVFLKE